MANVISALKKAILVPIFDRKALVARLNRLDGAHGTAARERTERLEAARDEYARWREPERKLRAATAAAKAEAQQQSREREQTEGQLWANPPRCVVDLREHVASTYSLVSRELHSGTFPRGVSGIGPALCAATIWCRDTGWKLAEDVADREARALRDAIDAAIREARRPKTDDEEDS